MRTIPAEAERGDTAPSSLGPHTVNERTPPTFSALWCFLLVMLLFKMPPKHSAEMPYQVPKYKKAYQENMCPRVDQLHSGMSYSAVGREFNANESTIYSK